MANQPKVIDTRNKKTRNSLLRLLRVFLKESIQKIETKASKEHRYTMRSGLLSKGFVKSFYDFYAEIELDRRVSYSYAIHQGHSGKNTKKNEGNQTWKEDPYLYDAANNSELEIQKDLESLHHQYAESIFQ